ncbi:MAG: pre-peptidase C-terminal domain-containing protein [Xanthobacteraceae bacterium]|nr:pre-peptidase C-terminal domain-containing protein [Xanthobacteraceae bacterium]
MMNRDLFLAVLAMDSYNRGNAPGVSGLSDAVGALIGDASVIGSKDDAAARAAGFYAIAYNSTSLGKIISYRGTDSNAGLEATITSGDALNGYGLALGSPYGPQATMAIDFYQQIVGAEATVAELRSAEVTLTGHSLGGGLAGLVGALYGKSGVLFDNMPFEGAAINGYVNAKTIYQRGHSIPGEAAAAAFLNDVYGSDEPFANSLSGLQGFATTGEFLTAARAAQSTSVSYLNPHAGLLNPFTQAHSSSLLVLLLYAQVYGLTAWQTVSPALIPRLFSSTALEIGTKLGLAEFAGSGADNDYAGVLRDLIAYSAISEGARPFGDTGIRAFYDDGNELGQLLSKTDVARYLKDDIRVQQALCDFVIEYAGLLARNRDIASGITPGDTGREKGALYFDSAANRLIGNFNHDLWRKVDNGQVGDEVDIVGKKSLADIATRIGSVSPSTFSEAVARTWLDASSPGGTTKHIVKLVAATTDAQAILKSETDGGIDENVPINGDGAMLIGAGAVDRLIGAQGKDLLIGGQGGDFLIGGSGDDLIFGGAGDDTIKGYDDTDTAPQADSEAIGFEGNDWIDGGDGKDQVDYSDLEDATDVSFDNEHNVSTGRVVTTKDGTGGTDTLVGVEIITLTDEQDTVTVKAFDGRYYQNALGPTLKQYTVVNMGDEPGDYEAGDTLDFSQYGKSLYLRPVSSADGPAVGQYLDRAYQRETGLQFKNFEYLIATSKDDQVRLPTTELKVLVDLGGGDDVFMGGGQGTIVYGGTGRDKFEVSHNVLIADAEQHDQITYFGNQLTGGVQWGASETPWTMGRFNIRYGIDVAGELVIRDNTGRETYVANFDADTDATFRTAGILLAQITVSAYRLFEIPDGASIFKTWEALMGTAMVALTGESRFGTVHTDPLILDLDGDGIELSARAAGSATFDIDGDGFAEVTGWVRGGDGLLARDLNANGKIDDIGELFGNEHQSGFAVLATLDTNADGVVDASDTDFSSLRVWRDIDGDGVTDAGELISLGDAGIASISVQATAAPANTTIAGNLITETAVFTRTDGSTGTVANAQLHQDDFNTVWRGDGTISSAAAALPEVKGYGTLTSLRVAATLDPTLIAVVENTLSLLNTTDLAALRQAAGPILTAWANAVPVPAGTPGTTPRSDFNVVLEQTVTGPAVRDYLVKITDSQGTYWGFASGADVRDAQGDIIERPTQLQVLETTPSEGSWSIITGAEITFLERYLGDPIDLDDAVLPGAVSALNSVLDVAIRQLDKIVVRLAMQGPLEPFFAGLEYDASTDQFRPTTEHQLSPMLEAIFGAAPATAQAATDYIAAWQDVVHVILPDLDRGGATIQASFAYLFQNVVSAYENVPIPLSLVEAAAVFSIPADLIVTGTGNITGTSDPDLFYLDSSDQTAEGGSGPDAYIVGANFGRDVIHDVTPGLGAGNEDAVRFAHLNASDLTFTRDGLDLVITQTGTDNEIRVVDEFAGRRVNPFGGYLDPDAQIEVITFADGTVWDKIDIAWAAVNIPQATDDALVGSPDMDVLDPGAGNDYLSGGDGGDVYLFGFGYGGDVVFDQTAGNPFDTSPDVISFNSGVTVADVSFARVGDSNDLMVKLSDGSVLTINDQFGRAYTALGNFEFNQIEGFLFDDGSIYSFESVNEILLQQATTDGDDRLIGFYTDDVLDGGSGDDYLDGRAGNDTYVFGIGSGRDTIHEHFNDALAEDDDTVQFGEGVAPSDIEWIFSDETITAHIRGTGDVLTILQGSSTDPDFRVENFAFSNGTVLSLADVIALSRQGTDGNDEIAGDDSGNALDGGIGNDYLIGNDGDDHYFFAPGDGADLIYDYAGAADVLEFGVGIAAADVTVYYLAGIGDLVLTFAGSDDRIVLPNDSIFPDPVSAIETFVFAGGTTWSAADLVAQAIEMPRAVAIDVDFTRVIDFDVADGLAAPFWGFTIGEDHVLNLHGVTPDDLVLQRVGDESEAFFFLGTAGPDGGGLIFTSPSYFPDIDRVVFDNGAVWDGATLDQRFLALAQTDGDDVIHGFYDSAEIVGGLGNDIMIGQGGADTYVYRRGDGFDRIQERGSAGTSSGEPIIDTLSFADIEPSEVKFSRGGLDDADLVIDVLGDEPGRVVVAGQFVQDIFDDRIERFVFADGTTLTMQQVEALVVAQSATGRDDRVIGWDGDDVIAGGIGDDHLIGGGGSDTYVWSVGDGRDVIENRDSEDGRTDTLVLHGVDPDDVTVVRMPGTPDTLELHIGGSPDQAIVLRNQMQDYRADHIGYVRFDDGTVWLAHDLVVRAIGGYGSSVTVAGTAASETISGTLGDDVIDAAGGDDVIKSGPGSDLVLFGAGYGNDVWTEGILDNALPGHLWREADTLRLVGLNPDDVELSRNQSELTVKILSTGETLKVTNQFDFSPESPSYGLQGIEQIEFADGTVWNYEQIFLEGAYRGTAGDDSLSGNIASESFIGLEGADWLQGGDGSDTYTWQPGDGDDSIVEYNSTDIDTLRLRGVDSADVLLTWIGNTLDVQVGDETIHVLYQRDGAGYGVERISFDDGTVWTTADINATAAIRGTSGDDSLGGTSQNDRLIGGLGDDYLAGGSGSDTYVYAAGDGNDEIDDQYDGLADVDTLSLVDLAPADVVLSTDAQGNLIIGILATGDEIVVDGEFRSDFFLGQGSPNAGVERLVFAGGTVWDRAAIAAAAGVITGTEGADVLAGGNAPNLIRGLGGDDTIAGHGSNDMLQGGGGSDTYVYAAGDGNDTIADSGNADSAGDTLQLTDLTAADVALSFDWNGQLTIDILSTGEYIAVAGQFLPELFGGGQPDDGIDSIAFSGGTVWGRADIAAAAGILTGTENADVINGGDGPNVIFGLGGDDVIDGGGDDDEIYGGTGADQIYGGFGDDSFFVSAGEGGDTIDGGEGDDYLEIDTSSSVEVDLSLGTVTGVDIGAMTVSNIEAVFTGEGDDTLIGSGGDNALGGWLGDDTLEGGGGDDYLEGGEGADTYVFNLGDGADVIRDQGDVSDTDVLILGAGIDPDDVSLSVEGDGDVILTIGSNGDVIRLVNQLSGPETESEDAVEEVRFADGTVWTAADIVDLINGGGGGELDIIKPQSTANTSIASAVTVPEEAFDLSENGNIFSSTTIPHATVVATASGQGQEFYAVTVGAGDQVIFDIDHGSFDTVIQLLDAGGSQLAFNDDNAGDPGSSPNSSLLSYTFAEAGTYYLAVGMYGTGAGPSTGATYTLNISIEAAVPVLETVDKPDVIKPGTLANTSMAASIDLAGSYDLVANANIEQATSLPHATVVATAYGGAAEYYTVEAAAGDRAIFDIDGASFDTIIDLLDAAGNVLASNDDNDSDPGSTSYSSLLNYVFDDAGTYYLRVREYGSGNSISAGETYTLHVSLESAGVEIAGGSGDDDITARQGDDTLIGGGGNDTLDGAAGTDTAVYSGDRADYAVTFDAETQTFTIADLRAGAPDGTDTVTDVELFQFADGPVTAAELAEGGSNTAPTDASLSAATVAENSADETVVGTVTGVDPDAGDVMTYTLVDDAGGRFAIDNESGIVTVADGTALDYETMASHDITVRVTDSDGLNFDKVFTITLTNVSGSVGGTGTDDVLVGTSEEDTIQGLAGNDSLQGGLGNDQLYGGDGTDTATGYGSNWSLAFADGRWTVSNGSETDTLDGIEKVVINGVTHVLVDQSGTGGYQSVQAGIDAASGGDVVDVAAGTYAENVTIAGKAVTVVGAGRSGSSVTTLQGQITVSGLLDGALALKGMAIDAAGRQYGVFVSSNSTAAAGSVTLDGVAISGAQVNGFAYIRAGNGSTPTLTDTIGSVSILHSEFSGNATQTSGSNGRGDILLFGFDGDLTIDDVDIHDPGAGAQKAIQMRGLQDSSDVTNVGPYDPAGNVSFTDLSVTGTYLQDLIAFYRIAGFESFVTSGVELNASAPWGLVNFDGVGGSIDLSSGFAGSNAAGGLVAVLQGLSSADTLTGSDSNDVLDGRDGADVISGGGGNDAILLASPAFHDAGESIDGGSGTDALRFVSTTAGQTLTLNAAITNVEEIEISNASGANTGTTALNIDASAVAGAYTLTGNDGANTLTAGSGNNAVFGGGGNDVITGGAGNDNLTGGSGNDTFVFKSGFGLDTITDFAAGAASDDVIQIQDELFADFAAVQAASAQVGSNVVITLDASNTITLQNVALANLHQDDFQFV